MKLGLDADPCGSETAFPDSDVANVCGGWCGAVADEEGGDIRSVRRFEVYSL